MANYNQLVSNPCFYELQAPDASKLPQTKSEILYANKFSGLDIPMASELRELFGSNEMNLTDINIRSQISHLLDQFDGENGPWYIDGVNGTLHIHNRRIADPSFVYRYQDENGEVLKVQIVTNWTTGSTSGTVASAITPDKNFDSIHYSDVKLDFTVSKDEVDIKLPRDVVITQDNVGRNNGHNQDFQYHLYGPNGEYLGQGNTQQASDVRRNGGYAKPLNYGDMIKNANLTPGDITLSLREAQKKMDSDIKTDTENLNDIPKAQEKGAANLTSTLDSWATDPDDPNAKMFDACKKELLQAIKESNIELNAKYIEDGFNYVLETGSLNGLPNDLQKIFSNPLHGDKFKGILPTTRTVKTFYAEGSPNGNYNSYDYGQTAGGNNTQSNKMPNTVQGKWVNIGSSIKEAQKWFQDNGFTTISTYVYPYGSSKVETYNKELNDLMQVAIDRALATSKTPNATIGKIEFTTNEMGTPIFRVTASGDYVATVPAYTYMNYLYTRNKPGGGSKKAKLQAYINSMMNRAKKAKHKEIEVQMIVIGRPLLSSGQYLYIGNIGKKYSGNWYVKTCIHQMDSNGYTCSLTLKKSSNQNSGAAMTLNKSRGKDLQVGGLVKFTFKNEGIEEDIWITPVDLNALKYTAAVNGEEAVKPEIIGILKQKEAGEYGPGNGRYEMVADRPIQTDRENNDEKAITGVGYRKTDEGKRMDDLINEDQKRAANAAKKANSSLSKTSNKKKK